MIYDVDQLEIAEHHMPLLRATAIDIFGRQPEEKVKSLTGREDIRRAILKALQDHMKKKKPVARLSKTLSLPNIYTRARRYYSSTCSRPQVLLPLLSFIGSKA